MRKRHPPSIPHPIRGRSSEILREVGQQTAEERGVGRRLLHLASGARKKMREFGKARATWLTPVHYDSVVALILRDADLRRALLPSLFPRSTRELGRYTAISATTASREIRWAGALIKAHALQLNVFTDFRNKVVTSIQTGSYALAIETLDMMEAELGTSFWLIKVRLALLQLTGGLDIQKKYAAALKKAVARPTAITAYIIHYASVRNEPSVTAQRFIPQMRARINNATPLSDLRAFMRHHITGPEIAHSTAIDVLRISTAASIIDTFEAFIYATRVIATSDQTELSSAAGLMLDMLAPMIPDPRIARIRARLDNDVVIPSSSGIDDRVEAWLRQTDLPTSTATNGIVSSSNWTFAHTWSTAAALTEKRVTSENLPTIVSEVASVQSIGVDVAQAETEIARNALNMAGLGLYELPQAIVGMALSPIPSGVRRPLPPLAESALVVKELALDYAMTDHVAAVPFAVNWVRPKARDTYVARATAELQNSATRDYLIGAVNTARIPCDTLLRSEEIQSLRAHEFLRAGDLYNCLRESQPLLNAGPYYQVIGLRLAAHCLLELREFGECVEMIAGACLANIGMRYVLPIQELTDQLDRHIRRSLGGRISLAILFDLYSRFVDGAYDQYRRRAYQDVLTAYSVGRPSELVNCLEPSIHLNYYLSHICVPEVMYVSPTMHGSRDLQEERIKILEYLSKVDAANRGDYDDERLDRARTLVLQARRVEAEQNRIYVDLDGLTREAARKYLESYERYIAFQDSGIDASTSDAVNHALSQILVGELSALRGLSLPLHEARNLFASLVRDLRDEFVDNERFGLDGHLSTGIRHGTLANELRGPLLAARLITQKDEASQQYRPNTAWFEAASDASTPAGRIQIGLASFAREFDSLLSEVVTDWVQVQREYDSRGAINLTLNDDELRVVEGLVTRSPPFDEFAYLVFAGVCIPNLSNGLTAIRQRIETVAKPRATAMLSRLQAVVEAEGERADVGVLSSAIREAGTSVQRAFDRVSSWFVLSEQISTDPLSLADGLQIALEIAKRVYPGFKATFDLGASGSRQVDGAFLPGLLVIFLTAFENAVTKAGFTDPPEVRVVVSERGDHLRFTLCNKVHHSVDVVAGRKRIDGIQAAIGTSEYLRSVRREGRSGLHKIVKIVRLDFLGAPDLDASFTSDHEFILAFSIPLHRGQNESASN